MFPFFPFHRLLSRALPGALLFALGSASVFAASWKFDFGNAEVADGYVGIVGDTRYSPNHGYGWTQPDNVAVGHQDRPNALLRDFAAIAEPTRFRIDLDPGIYRLRVTCGDMYVGNHATLISVAEDVPFPVVQPEAGEFITVSAAFRVERPFMEVTFESRAANWLVNAMTIEAVDELEEVQVERERHGPPPRQANPTGRATWPELEGWENPVAAHVARFRERLPDIPPIHPTGLRAGDYLSQIAGNVDFFKQHQNADGAIIDPYEEDERQYTTPAFALAAATLVRYAGRDDLMEAAANAMDWATHSLRTAQAPQQHEHFFPHMLAHALTHFEAIDTEEERLEQWRTNLRDFDARSVYRGVGGGNWNVVAAAGQGMLYLKGVRDDLEFVESSLAIQGRYFNDWGLYIDGRHEAMAYDHFPRLWLNDLLAHGWDRAHAEELHETLWRGALTSLFIQSPAGELPTGMRSAHHQWNEAQQAATFEIFGRMAAESGDAELAGAFKRAARLSLMSIRRWTRPSGELWIVKNRADPSLRRGYEAYSFHSQYNLLAMGMLAIAHEHARHTDDVEEIPAPADAGGFLIDLREYFHKVIANAGGHYLLIDTEGDINFNPTGLLRVHHRHGNPQLGPTEGLVASRSGVAAAAGAAWQNEEGGWRSLAGMSRGDIEEVALHIEREEIDAVAFELTYRAEFDGADEVVERYLVTPERIRLQPEVRGSQGAIRLTVPLLADDGERETVIEAGDDSVRLRLGLDVQRFAMPGAARVYVEEDKRPYRNGWARIAVGEVDPETSPLLEISTESSR